MAFVWQQVLALDARYNAYRAPNHPNFRTLYIRRRSQLLRECASRGEHAPAVLRQYLRCRTQLLQQRYGAAVDQGSAKSRSLSAVSSSRLSESPQLSRHASQYHISSSGNTAGVVPTKQAEASRAIVGGTSLEENYAFSGVHYIFDQHSAGVTAVLFAHNDRSLLACASLDGTISICRALPQPCVEKVLKGHSRGITDIQWSESNDLLVSCSLDGTLRVWNPYSGACLRCLGNSDEVDNPSLLCCVFQPINNNMVLIGSSSGSVQVVNISAGKVLKGGVRLSGRVLCLTFEASGETLWCGSSKGCLVSFLVDLASGRLTQGRRVMVCEGCPVTCVSSRSWISREARDPSLLVNCASNALFLFRVSDAEGTLQLRRTFPLRHEKHKLRSAFCPMMSFRQGACVVSGSEDGSVYFLDVEREGSACVNCLQGHAAAVLGVHFNYDESLLATADAHGLVILWKRS